MIVEGGDLLVESGQRRSKKERIRFVGRLESTHSTPDARGMFYVANIRIDTLNNEQLQQIVDTINSYGDFNLTIDYLDPAHEYMSNLDRFRQKSEKKPE